MTQEQGDYADIYYILYYSEKEKDVTYLPTFPCTLQFKLFIFVFLLFVLT